MYFSHPYPRKPSCIQCPFESALEGLSYRSHLFFRNCKADWVLATGLQPNKSNQKSSKGRRRRRRSLDYRSIFCPSKQNREVNEIVHSMNDVLLQPLCSHMERDLSYYLWDHNNIGTHFFHSLKNITGCSRNSSHACPVISSGSKQQQPPPPKTPEYQISNQGNKLQHQKGTFSDKGHKKDLPRPFKQNFTLQHSQGQCCQL